MLDILIKKTLCLVFDILLKGQKINAFEIFVFCRDFNCDHFPFYFCRRLFSIMSYFFFFYNILLGVISCVGRIFKGMLLGVIFLSRIDRTSLMQGFQTWDQGM